LGGAFWMSSARRVLAPFSAEGRPTLSANISANLVLRAWTAILQIFLTPLIVHQLGPQGYGLVGFSSSLTLFLMFLDQCISPTLARELARIGPLPDEAQQARNVLRTMEIISCITAVVIGGSVVIAAQWIARYGIAGSGLPQSELTTVVVLIGIGLAVQWPAMLYSGGFIGLQRQEVLVAIRMVLGTVIPVGAVLLLWLLRPSVEVYLAWTALMSLLTSVVTRIALWHTMPPGATPRAEFAIARHLWRFAAGNLLLGLTAALIVQGPGLIVAKYCSLADLAAYTLAVSLAQQLSTILTQPVSSALMPHFTQLVARGDETTLAREYHRWSQINAALLLPAAATLVWAPRPLMQLWLGANSPLAEPVAKLLPWVAVGTLLNTLVTPPYILQLATGWSQLLVRLNLVTVAVYLPATLALAPIYGPIAPAACWVAVNLCYLVIYVPGVHRRLLRGELMAWWVHDTARPLFCIVLLYSVASVAEPTQLPLAASLLLALTLAATSVGVLMLCLPYFRADAVVAIRRVLTIWRPG